MATWLHFLKRLKPSIKRFAGTDSHIFSSVYEKRNDLYESYIFGTFYSILICSLLITGNGN